VIELKDMLVALASRPKRPKEMSMGELRQHLTDAQKGTPAYREHLIEFLERFAIPIGAFLMSVVGVPLGAQIRGRGRSTGIGISLVLFVVYYICLAGAKNLAESGAVHPALGVWIPNAFLVAACVFLLLMASRERSMNPVSLLRSGRGTRF
jgi:lipopolysaccharide export system permease protein